MNELKIIDIETSFIYKNKKFIVKTDHETYLGYINFLKTIVPKDNNSDNKNSLLDINYLRNDWLIKNVIKKNRHINLLFEANQIEIIQIINFIDKCFLIPPAFPEDKIKELLALATKEEYKK